MRALSELSLGIEEGECVALVGPSGSGKTTALRLIAGLEVPTSGTIRIGGAVINEMPPKRRDVAMVFQNPALYPHMTVYENLALGLKLRKCPRPELERQVREAAEMLGVSTLLDSLPMQLSAGQRQRVALGRAMVRRTTVLLLDEPLANVDPGLRVQMRHEILELRRHWRTTMIYVTHDHVEAMLVGDRVAVLSEGKLQQVAAPRLLYRHPANLFVAGFVGAPMNLFRGTLADEEGRLFFQTAVAGQVASTVALKLLLPPRFGAALRGLKAVVLGLRPEHIACCLNNAGGPGRSVAAKLVAVEALGPDLYLRANSAVTQFVARVPASLTCIPGTQYRFEFDLEQASFFDPASGNALSCPGES